MTSLQTSSITLVNAFKRLEAKFAGIIDEVCHELEAMFEERHDDPAELRLRQDLTDQLPSLELDFDGIKSELARIKHKYERR